MFTDIRDILEGKKNDEKVSIRGWIFRTRSSGSIAFLTIRDPTDVIQVTVKKGNLPDEEFEEAKKALVESSIMIEGRVKEDHRAPGGYEIKAESVKIHANADVFPITKDQSEEFLMDNRHLWVRSQKLTNAMKVRSTVFGAIHEYFRDNGYIEVQAPSLTGTACEGGSTLFEVKYFDRKAYLTQTWQLYAEALIFSLGKIYGIAPSFRAEKSKTSRHITEFWHAEMEAAWMEMDDAIDLAEGLVSHVFKTVADKNAKELEFFGRTPEDLLKVCPPFERITYDKALELLKKEGMNVPYGKDLRTVEEETLSKFFDKPIFVTHYPTEIMAFYKPEDPDTPGKALCFDMLATDGYGEIIGGSQRDESVENLVKRLEKEGENIENYDWYLDLRRYGSVPHSGFGMGVERIVRWILHLDHIRDAVPFPRTINRLTP